MNVAAVAPASHRIRSVTWQKVVLIRVDSIAQDGTLNLTLTAWNVPR